MKKILLIIGLGLLLSGCDDYNSPVAVPELVTTAPDGTQLWVLKNANNGYNVYFSSKGTSTLERHFKTTRAVNVPNAN
jgi:hypothetical protein